MAEFFADQFTETLTDATEIQSGFRSDVGVSGRQRYKRGRTTLTTGVVATDVIHFMKLRSGDRVQAIKASDANGSTVTAGDIGIYIVQEDGTGSLTAGGTGDKDLFASALALNAGADRAEAFVEAGTLDGTDRGDRLWELLAKGAGSDTVDPFAEYYITLTLTGSVTTGSETISIEVEYTSGD